MVEGRAQHILHRKALWVHGNLRDEAQTLARGDKHLAAVGLLLAGQDPEEGGLARAVAAQDAHPLTGVHLEGQAVQHRFAYLVFFY